MAAGRGSPKEVNARSTYLTTHFPCWVSLAGDVRAMTSRAGGGGGGDLHQGEVIRCQGTGTSGLEPGCLIHTRNSKVGKCS